MMDNTLPPLEPQPLVPPPVESPPVKKYWGAWATIGFGAIVIAAIIMVQGIVAVVFAVSELLNSQEMDIEQFIRQLESDGNLFSAATFATFFVGIVLVLIFIKVRQGAGLKDYLALNSISKKTVLGVVAIIIGFFAFSYIVSRFQTSESDSNMMLDAYRSVTWAPMLWIAAVICAPLFEEAFFRGFLFTGLQQSKVGTIGTIFLTALPWAMLHVQYDIVQIAMIFFLGILLGIARATSRSLWSPLLIHALNNLLAMVEIYLRVSGTIS